MRFLILVLTVPAVYCVEWTRVPNDWPVIGVLIQEFGPPNISYIPSSYVKFVEAAGARVVPIHINRDGAYYQKILPQLNGVLFPGGSVGIENSGYAIAGRVIFEYALRANQRGEYFPLWGTCNGFEMLSFLAIDENVLTPCNAMNDPRPLKLTPYAKTSRLFGGLESDLLSHLTKENTTANFHEYCLTMTNFTKYGISQYYDPLSTNHDIDGLEYISSMEAKHYPFYAVQFHPEKNVFEWVNREGHSNIPHTEGAIEVAQFFARFFIDEARKSNHRMPSDIFERESIYNFQAEYTGHKSVFMQTYFFNE
ncbi:gamma-glutamyl hydrolase-like [Galendromus occidentalis]|uniref:folate gamma-glutamyl hydrolase n=1 Tax=Galendromus occidentalis TaxID=34638 RepID=A0AAJ6VVX6_9ACAR|nr:gamma-glutamyl hydrolase-like [Galendromus occidentalis]